MGHMNAASDSSNKPTTHRPDPARIDRILRRRSYGVLSTVSPAGYPHAAGVIYALAGDHLYINTAATSRKARNIEQCDRIAMVIPVRRVPVGGPPSAVQFQSTATLLAPSSDTVGQLLEQGQLGSITGHGELELPDSCFLQIALPDRLVTYGLGMPLLQLIRHPLDAAGVVDRRH